MASVPLVSLPAPLDGVLDEEGHMDPLQPHLPQQPPALVPVALPSSSAPSGNGLASSSNAVAVMRSSSAPLVFSGSVPASTLFDLSQESPLQLQMSRETWIRVMPKEFATALIDLSPVKAMAVLVAYQGTDGHPLSARLAGYSSMQLKKLCAHLLLPLPDKGSSDVTGKCRNAILDAVARHVGRYPHLVGPFAAARDVHQSDVEEGEEDDEDEDEEEEEESKGQDARPPRSTSASAVPVMQSPPRRTARDTSSTNAKIAIAKSALSKTVRYTSEARTSSPPRLPRDAGVLAAFAALPSEPSVRHSHRSYERKTEGKHKKKKKSSKHRHADFSEDDSDSDGPSIGQRDRERAVDSSDPSSSSSDSSSEDSSDSSIEDDRHHREGKRKKKHHSRSSTSSRRDVVDEMESSGLARPLAKAFIRNALAARGGKGLILDVFKEHEFKSTRNEREVLALARVLDALRKGDWRSARELVVRRLVGVQSADTSGNWKICDAFELVMDRQSFVPDAFLARAIKNVHRMEALEGKKSTPVSGASREGKQSKRRQNNSHRDSNGGPRDRSSDSRAPGQRSSSNKGDNKSKESRGP